MAMNRQSEIDKNEIISLVLVPCIIFILLEIVFVLIGGPGKYSSLCLDNLISTKIERADGTVEYYDGTSFPAATKGDSVIFSIPLPKDQMIESAVITCNVPQSVATLKYGDRIIYSYGEDIAKKGRQIGNVYMMAAIPDEAWGSELELRWDVADYNRIIKISQVMVYRSTEHVQVWLSDKLVSFITSISGLFFFLTALLFLILWHRLGRIRFQGIFLSSFCISVITWRMGYSGMLNMFLMNTRITSNLEYIGLYAAVPFFCFFLRDVYKDDIIKRVMDVLGGISGVFFVVATILNYTTEKYHYCRLLRLEHLIMAVLIVVCAVGLFCTRKNRGLQQNLIWLGITQYGFFVIMDLMLYYINVSVPDTLFITNIIKYTKSVSNIGLFIFLICLVVSYILKIRDYFISEKEKERLEKLAYCDGMTGILNRRACMEAIDGLKDGTDYGIAFFDVNNLKQANDLYGHDTGDRLICFVADAVRDIFENEGFCGRYGGDEFVAGVYSEAPDRMESLLDEFRNIIDEANEDKKFEFTVSVSCGYAYGNEKEEMTKEEAVKIADMRMYENKRQMKGVI